MKISDAEKLISPVQLQSWIARGKLRKINGEVDDLELKRLIKYTYLPKGKWFTNREGEIIKFWVDACSEKESLCKACRKRVECEALFEKLGKRVYSR